MSASAAVAPGPTAGRPAMTDSHFAILAAMAHQLIGFDLNETKRQMIQVRLLRRVRRLGLDSFDTYCALLQQPDSPEAAEFIDAITTNVTSFFREPHHFDFLAEQVVPRALAAGRSSASGARLRIWCAGCSSGQEAYSVAATVAASVAPGTFLDCKILATDIDSGALVRARRAHYSESDRQAVAAHPQVSHWFENTADGGIEPNQQLRDMVFVRSLNLVDHWPMTGPLDVIFCRNVAIYFSAVTQRRLYNRMAELLGSGGFLITGHSEAMPREMDQFQAVGHTIYQIVSRSGLGE